MRTHLLSLLAVAAIAAPATASAATTIDGTLAGVSFNVGSSTSLIGVGTTFTNAGTLVAGTTGQFSSVSVFTLFSLATFTAAQNSTVSFTGAFGTYTGTINSVTLSGSTASRVLTVVALGTFTPSGTISSYAAGAASLTFSLNQTGGSGSAVSSSFTLASPPTGVPEPMTWSMILTGAGFAGAALRRSKKKATVAVA